MILTAGFGVFEAIAPRVAVMASRFMGWPVYSILPWHFDFSVLPHPAWVKAFIWDFVPEHVERLVWVDADAVCIRPFGTLPGAAFSAVEDCDSTFKGERKKLTPVNECDRYFNSGLFVCTRQSRPVFDELKDMMFEREHGGCLEQSWLNILVQRRLGGFDPMPRGCNWIPVCSPDKPGRLRVIHLAGWDMRYRIPAIHALLESLSIG
ncbi:MAG: hypothetical protein L6Q69_18205 [Zoogloea sp.]|nr:hypothetical protein [Zoogloea sp.]